MSKYELIATVLSLISFCIVLYDFFFKLGKQKIEQFRHYGFKLASYYFKTADFETNGALLLPGTENNRISATISVRVINNSAYPITIDSAFVSIDGKESAKNNYHDNAFTFKPKNIPTVEKGVQAFACLDVPDKAELPITLNPYETKIFSLNIPHFEYYVKRYGDTVFPYLHLTTARKTHSLKVEVPEYNALMSEPPREI